MPLSKRRKLLFAVVALAAAAASAGVAFAAFSATTSNSGNSLAASSSFKACNYPSTVQATPGLVNYWRLGETSGTTAADSQGTSTGTYVGSPALGQTGAIAGDANKAARFDGVNDTVNVTDTAALRLNGSWAVEFWAKAISFPASGWPGVFKKGDATTSSGFLLFFDHTTGGFTYKRNNQSSGITGMDIVTGVYRHYILSYNGTTLKGYENGVEVYSAAVSWPSNAGTATFQLGTADNFGNVDIDDFAVYSTIISPTDALAHFRCGQRYRDVVKDTTGLQSYWRLSEPLGDVAFDSQGTVDGTYTGPPALGQTGALTATGDLGASFDSVDDWADFGDVFDFTGTVAFSAEGWINRGALRDTGYRWIVGKDTTNAPREGWNMNLEANTNKVRFERWSNNTNTVVLSTTATVVGTWYYLAATYDGTTMRLYVNGTLEGSLASSLVQANTTFPLRVGAIGGTGGGKFHGTIDEVAVYNVALSATQVKQHYDAR